MTLSSTYSGLDKFLSGWAGYQIVRTHFDDPADGRLCTALATKSTWNPRPPTITERHAMQAMEVANAGHLLPHLPSAHDGQMMLNSVSASFAQDAELLFDTSYVFAQDLHDQRRSFRVAVEGESLKLINLSSAPHLAQVFLDVLNCHKLLYDNHCVLYGDISLSMRNITCRFDEEGHIYGVLNDMDRI
ncbi:hypothetical protein CPB85DRAFT_1560515 [Mucidula mucida]|nr:hypothetical protein CPB85DRAFT_1560515 [Mucidula mucida]